MIPAITLYQPWASWIADGLKTIESRRHANFSRLAGSRVAIHAGKSWDPMAVPRALPFLKRRGAATVLREMLDSRPPVVYPRGAIIATAFVDEHRRLGTADSRRALCDCDGAYGLLLSDVRRVEPPIRWRGSQGIWYVPPTAFAACPGAIT